LELDELELDELEELEEELEELEELELDELDGLDELELDELDEDPGPGNIGIGVCGCPSVPQTSFGARSGQKKKSSAQHCSG